MDPKSKIRFRLPLLDHLRGYRKQDFKADARAGLNVALLDFPQGMAYALLAGLPVQHGVYSSALASVTGPLFASSRFLMLGPTNATAVLLLSAFLTLDVPEEQRLLVLPVLLLMVAGLFFLGAAVNAGVVTRYISRTVVTGYITAAALLIIANQLRHVLGIEVPRAAALFTTVSGTVARLGETQVLSLAVAAGTIVLYLAARRWARGWPHVAVTLVVVSAATWALGRWTGLSVPCLTAIPAGHWPLSWPVLDAGLIGQLANSALAIAFLALLESNSIARTLAARAGDAVNIRQQMVSMGAANLANAFGSGMPASGSLTRSVLNFQSGARTPVASLVSGLLLAAGALALGPALGLVPRPALAALVIMVGVSLIDREAIRLALRTTRTDAIVFAATFGAGLLVPLDTAIYLGVVTSLVLFLHRVSSPRLVEYAFNERGELTERPSEAPRAVPALSIVHVEGDLFFGSTDVFLEQMRLLVQQPKLRVILLRLRNAHHLDATAAQAVRDLVRFARERGREVIVTGAQPEIAELFERSGLLRELGERNFFRHTPENPNLATRDALRRAQEITGEKRAEIILFARPKDEAEKE